MKDERLSPEEIHYMENGCSFAGGHEFRYHVTSALSRIPASIAKAAISKYLFICVTNYGFFLPKSIDKNIIIFQLQLLELPDDEIQKMILHEVAHFHLKHEHPLTIQGLEMKDSLTADQYEKTKRQLMHWWTSGLHNAIRKKRGVVSGVRDRLVKME